MSTSDKEVLHKLLLREMEERNWSQRKMAKACQVSNTTISKIVRGHTVPDPNTCFKIAQGLELSIPHILKLAGHEMAEAQDAPPTLKATLHAHFDHLPERAILEMIGALQAIDRTYTAPTGQDLELAQQKLENLEFVRRWLDPIKRKTLTVVQGGTFLFYQTADLDEEGQETNHSELSLIEEDLSGLSMFPVHRFANSYCVQIYPLCEFDAHRCQSHPQHTILFTPIYAGDRGSGVLVTYPDGRQVTVRDQTTERVWQKLYADISFGKDMLSMEPSLQAKEYLGQIKTRWQEHGPDELWVNPDAQRYAAFFEPLQNDNIYYLLTGPLAEINTSDWKAASADRIEIIDAALYGRFENSVVHLQGFCIKLYPQLGHITATRHIVPTHRTLTWEQEQTQHILIVHEYLETWLHLSIEKKDALAMTVEESTPLRAEIIRRRVNQLAQDLQVELE